MLHSDVTTGNIHPAHNWAVADSTARLALSLNASDVGKLCWQQDDNTLYILTATTPTWIQVGGSLLDLLARNNTWTKAQRGAFVALTSSSASIAVNLALANNFNHTLTENTTLAAPSNVVAGQAVIFQFNQHASAPKTLAFNSFWKFPGGAPSPVLTATNSAVDIVSCLVAADGSFAICTLANDIS